ncbi:MAG: Flp pilus assembly protein CpaB [Devosia sp.]
MRMSRILLLLLALVAGGLAAFLATRGGDVQPDQPLTSEVVPEERVQILVATAPIGMGERLSDTNISWQDWPKGALRDGYIDSASMPEALTDMKGTVARFEIFEGDPIRQQKLVKTDQGYLSAVLEKGMRGVSISVSADSASGGFIVPNDHVDVILTRSTAGGQQAETLLSNVRVLAIGKRLGEAGKTGAPAAPEDPRAEVFDGGAIATLELDPVQTETVINAGQLGKLSLALRSIVDFAKAPGEEDNMKRNAPIKIIRYGTEVSVMTGATATTPTVDPASYTVPPTLPAAPAINVTATPAPAPILE